MEMNFNINAFAKPTTKAEFLELVKEAHRAIDEILAGLKADTAYMAANYSPKAVSAD